MTWVKVLLLVISLALNVHWATAKRSTTADNTRAVEIELADSETSNGNPIAKPLRAPIVEERPPLPIGHLRLPWNKNLHSIDHLCFKDDEWQLSELAVAAFELTPDAEAQINQALGRWQTEIFRMEAQRVEKHSDWHYTLGALTQQEVTGLRASFRSYLNHHLEAVQADAIAALAFSHDYFLDDPYRDMEVKMMSYRDHLEVQLGSPNRTMTIPYGGTFHPMGPVKRISHLIDFEPAWKEAFEETRKLRSAE